MSIPKYVSAFPSLLSSLSGACDTNVSAAISVRAQCQTGRVYQLSPENRSRAIVTHREIRVRYGDAGYSHIVTQITLQTCAVINVDVLSLVFLLLQLGDIALIYR